MSTNYYAKHPNYPTGVEGLHIGKHSGGWEFLWRAHPNIGITSTAQWRRFLDHPWVTITTETGEELILDEFWETATARDASANNPIRRSEELHVKGDYWAERQWRDQDGHPFAEYEFC